MANLKNQAEELINLLNSDVSVGKRKARQSALSRATGAGLSSASLGDSFEGYDSSADTFASQQKNQIRNTFAQLQASEDAMKAEREYQDKVRAEQATQQFLGAVGGLAGYGVGTYVLPKLFGDKTEPIMTEQKLPQQPSMPTTTGTTQPPQIPTHGVDEFGKLYRPKYKGVYQNGY